MPSLSSPLESEKAFEPATFRAGQARDLSASVKRIELRLRIFLRVVHYSLMAFTASKGEMVKARILWIERPHFNPLNHFPLELLRVGKRVDRVHAVSKYYLLLLALVPTRMRKLFWRAICEHLSLD